MGNAPGPVLPGARRRKPTPADGRSQPGAPVARSGAAVRRRLTWRVLRRLSSPGNFSCRHRSDRSRLARVPAPPRGEGRPRGHRARTGASRVRGGDPRGARDALTPFAVRAAEVLDALALSLAEGRSPPALPPELAMDAAAGALPPLVRTRVERLTRQLKTLHDAVERWVSARAREPSGTGARDAQRPAVGLAPRKGAAPY